MDSGSRIQDSSVYFGTWFLSIYHCSFPLGSLISSKLVPSGVTSSPWFTSFSWLLWWTSGHWVSLDPPRLHACLWANQENLEWATSWLVTRHVPTLELGQCHVNPMDSAGGPGRGTKLTSIKGPLQTSELPSCSAFADAISSTWSCFPSFPLGFPTLHLLPTHVKLTVNLMSIFYWETIYYFPLSVSQFMQKERVSVDSMASSRS